MRFLILLLFTVVGCNLFGQTVPGFMKVSGKNNYTDSAAFSKYRNNAAMDSVLVTDTIGRLKLKYFSGGGGGGWGLTGNTLSGTEYFGSNNDFDVTIKRNSIVSGKFVYYGALLKPGFVSPVITVGDYGTNSGTFVPPTGDKFFILPNVSGTTATLVTSVNGVPPGADGNVPTSAGWGLTGNSGTISGTNFIGTTDAASLSLKVNNSRTAWFDSTGGRLNLENGLNPHISLRQLTSNQHWLIRVGLGTGTASQALNIYDSSAGIRKSRFGISTNGSVYVGRSTNPYSSSSLYVSNHTGGAGANIDAQSDSTILDEGNIEIMASDYTNSKGIAMRHWGNVGVSGTVVGQAKKNLALLDFTEDNNVIRTSVNRSLRIATNSTLAMVIDSNQRVGIGVSLPSTKFHLNGASGFRYVDGNQANGKVLVSDANGVGIWQTAGVPNLQSVTTVGSSTTVPTWFATPFGTTFGEVGKTSLLKTNLLSTDHLHSLPNADGTFVLTVNGVPPTDAGDISGIVVGPASATDNAIAVYDGTTGKLIKNSPVTVNATSGALTVAGATSSTYSAKKIEYDNTLNQWIIYNNNSNIAGNLPYELWFNCTNNTGSSIPNGSVVYISGASSGSPTIALAQANAAATSVAVGITTETIANGASGTVTQSGLVNGVNTASLSAGAVYVSETTPGALTNTPPSAPNYRMRVGFVGVINASTGTILVTPSTAALGNPAANQIIGMNAAGTAQEAKTIAGTTNQVTITHTANTITASLPAAINVNTTGSAATITTTRTFAVAGSTGLTAAAQNFNGSANVSLPLAGTLVAANGGTGQATYAIGDILYASTTSALSRLAGVATGNALISGGTGTAPAWGKIGLTTHVSGTLPLANGGTGNTAYTTGSIPFSNGTTITQDNSNFFWDNTQKQLGVGTNVPGTFVSQTGITGGLFNIKNTSNYARIYAQGNGGLISIADLTAGSNIKQLQFRSYGGLGTIEAVNDAGSGLTQNFMEFNLSNGRIGMGGASADSLLTVNGGLRTSGGIRAGLGLISLDTSNNKIVTADATGKLSRMYWPTSGGGGGGLGYNVYVANVSQSGTSAPTATVLENTLGGTVVWTRTGIGTYEITLTGAFTSGKTWINMPAINNVDIDGAGVIAFQAKRISANVIEVAVRGGGVDREDDWLVDNPIEIRVYP